MQVTARDLSGAVNAPKSNMSEAEHVRCMSQITPVVVGLSKFASFLKATQALSEYSGGRKRRAFSKAPKDGTVYRLHHLRPIEYKKNTIVSRVGLGRGWEKYGQGVPVDSPRRKFNV